MRSTRRCSTSSPTQFAALGRGRRRAGRGAARHRPPLLHRRRPRIARRRRARRSLAGAASHPAGRARGARRPAEADRRGRARRRDRRRRGLRGLLRRRHRHRRRVLLDPGGAGRHGAARRHAVPDPRHGPSQLPALRTVRRTHSGRGRAAARSRARGLRGRAARRHAGADRRRPAARRAGRDRASSSRRPTAMRFPSLADILAPTAPRRTVRNRAEAREGIASFREKRKPSWYPQ